MALNPWMRVLSDLIVWARNLISSQSFLTLDYSLYLLIRCLPWAVFRISTHQRKENRNPYTARQLSSMPGENIRKSFGNPILLVETLHALTQGTFQATAIEGGFYSRGHETRMDVPSSGLDSS
jgi:hypothetical protein